jgi:hypothetical protein
VRWRLCLMFDDGSLAPPFVAYRLLVLNPLLRCAPAPVPLPPECP